VESIYFERSSGKRQPIARGNRRVSTLPDDPDMMTIVVAVAKTKTIATATRIFDAARFNEE
jgi:hypothetical protein